MTDFTPSPTQTRPLSGAITRDWTCTAATAIGKLLVLTGDESAGLANATAASGEKGFIGMIVSGALYNVNGTISAGEKVTVVVHGPVAVGDIALVANTNLFVATTDGNLTDTKPTHGHQVAVAQKTNVIFIQQSPDKDYV